WHPRPAQSAAGVVISNKPADGDTIYVDRDRSISLSCRPVSTETSLTLFWYHPRNYYTPVSNQDMNKQVHEPAVVNPPEVVSEDYINVRIIQRIEINYAPTEQWIPFNKTSTIFCSFKGSDISDWRRRYTINPLQGLIISPSLSSDQGTYVCQARSTGSDFMDVNIVVRVFHKPEITYGPVIKYPAACINGMDCYLKCMATGTPVPQVIWYRAQDRNRPPSPVRHQQVLRGHPANVGELRIAMAEFLKDDDTYICRAVITADMYTEAEIDVVVHLIPQFRNYQAMMNPGGPARRYCGAGVRGVRHQPAGPAVPEVRHLRAVYPPQSGPLWTGRVHRLHLEIKRTVYLDSWNYTCMAPNLTSNNVSMMYGWLRNVTNITCISYGLPHPQWRWYRQFAEIPPYTDNGTYRIFTWDYEIYSQSWLQRWVFDRYICNASNRIGSGRHEMMFYKALGPPRVTVVSTTASSVQLDVQPPAEDGGMHLWYYELTYSALSGQLTWYGPVQFALNSDITIHGLMPSTDYSIRVRARNAVGVTADNMQLPLQIRTKDRGSPDPVIFLSSNRSTYPYSQTLRWKVPVNGGDPLVGYEIRVRPVFYDPARRAITGYKGGWILYRPPFYNPYLSEYRVTDLEASTWYEAEIKALSRVGESQTQRTVFLTAAPDALGRPDRVLSRAPPALAPSEQAMPQAVCQSRSQPRCRSAAGIRGSACILKSRRAEQSKGCLIRQETRKRERAGKACERLVLNSV
uniref:Cell adhesion molecule n=1 Tax=Macrostomum lignano TaxID=282301 RepID=A0A1I8FV44_9PLAT